MKMRGINKKVHFSVKHLKYYLFATGIITIFIWGLFWLAFTLLFLLVSYMLIRRCCRLFKTGWLQKTATWALALLYVFVISAGIRIFIFDLYTIPSQSMEDTLISEDVVLVNKLVYGPKLPDDPFEISWIKLLFHPNKDERTTVKKNERNNLRLKGTAGVKQGDVLVYRLSNTVFVVKRCVAIAGDTLLIDSGEVYCNSKVYLPAQTVKYRYNLTFENRELYLTCLDSLYSKNSVLSCSAAGNCITGVFTNQETMELSKNKNIHLSRALNPQYTAKELFANPPNTQWTPDHMGPFIVPRQGMSISLTPETYALYKKILSEHENVNIEERPDGYYLNGKQATTYTFRQNYYFLMGDNRDEALDSRYVGFKPEETIVGKVQCVLFSNHGNRFRRSRFLKSIH